MVVSDAPPGGGQDTATRKLVTRRSSRVSPLDCAIGERVRARRKALKLSMGEVATHLGVSHQQLQKYETGRNRIGASRLPALAQLLGCSVEDLMPAVVAAEDDASADTAACDGHKGSAFKRALAKPDVVRAVLLFDAIQAPAQRLAALAVLESLRGGSANIASPAAVVSAEAP